ncbi:hypothetical protein [Niveibacterium sp. SC-1]|uniref:dioxygenase family protein n=1 Tax=Niveibacterium sp. SC-1 TaxID=3135646 RepID=UPI00311FB562
MRIRIAPRIAAAWPDDERHDGLALARDLQALAEQRVRRRTLGWLLGAGAAGLLGCGGSGAEDSANAATTGSSGSTDTGSTSSTSASCVAVPQETAGPYPGDGSNLSRGTVANALNLSGVARSDIRASFAGATGVAQGVPMTVTLQLVDSNSSCADLAGYAVYLWHCDRDGDYSMYSANVTSENYLRGVQVSDANGQVSFTTIFPGCYSGRMPHMHFEVFRSAAAATAGANALRTSQLAFPTDVCSTVYDTASGYGASVRNFAAISFATDNVFSDGVSTQLATVTGSVSAGYAAALTVGLPA